MLKVEEDTSGINYSTEVQQALEELFVKVEKAIGVVIKMHISYESWGLDVTPGTLWVQALGNSELVPFKTLCKRSETGLFEGFVEERIAEMIDLALDETPRNENSIGTFGEIRIDRAGTQLKIVWAHIDKFVVKELDETICLDTEDWRRLAGLVSKLGAYQLLIEYQGSDDSMDGTNYEFRDDEDHIFSVDPASNEVKTIDKAFDALLDGPIEGFWNGEGGIGEIKITPVEEDSYWKHFNNKNVSEKTVSKFEVYSKLPEQVSEISRIEAISDPVWG